MKNLILLGLFVCSSLVFAQKEEQDFYQNLNTESMIPEVLMLKNDQIATVIIYSTGNKNSIQGVSDKEIGPKLYKEMKKITNNKEAHKVLTFSVKGSEAKQTIKEKLEELKEKMGGDEFVVEVNNNNEIAANLLKEAEGEQAWSWGYGLNYNPWFGNNFWNGNLYGGYYYYGWNWNTFSNPYWSTPYFGWNNWNSLGWNNWGWNNFWFY